MKLDDRVAIVTGATGGIGLGIAKAFVNEGCRVVITGRTDARGQAALEHLDAPDRAWFVAGDAKRQTNLEEVIDRTVADLGRLDILVNNSGGVTEFAPIADMTDELWDEMIRWNLYGPFWASRRALRYFLPQRAGRIINISSLEGKHGRPTISHYAAAKHGLHGLTKSLAQEVGTAGVTVNAICPGFVRETESIRNQAETAAAAYGMTVDEFYRLYEQESALKRFVTVDEIAALAVLLASDEGAGITGTAISIDGGTATY